MIVQALAAQFAAFQALLLAASGAHKAFNWTSSRNVVSQFAGVPLWLAAPALAAAVVAEFAAAVLSVVPAERTIGAALASLIFASYLGLILRAIAQGRRDVDCGCSFGRTHRPLDSFQVTRNSLLLGMGLLLAFVSATRGSVAVQASQVLGACALLALYGALDQVLALRPLRSGELL